MKDHCARAVCNATATGAFVTNVPACTAWLVDLGEHAEAVPLCAAHIARFSVPVGWTLHDERTTAPARSKPAKAAKPAKATTPAKPAKATTPAKPAKAKQSASLAPPSAKTPAAPETTAPETAAPDSAGPDPADESAADDPAADESADESADHGWAGPIRDDDVETVVPSSPLLSRAFQGPDDETGDQRRLAIFQRSTRDAPATLDDELPFPPSEDAPIGNGN